MQCSMVLTMLMWRSVFQPDASLPCRQPSTAVTHCKLTTAAESASDSNQGSSYWLAVTVSIRPHGHTSLCNKLWQICWNIIDSHMLRNLSNSFLKHVTACPSKWRLMNVTDDVWFSYAFSNCVNSCPNTPHRLLFAHCARKTSSIPGEINSS